MPPPETTTNELIHERSPYLLQHAHNPVPWKPWGQAAFDEARRREARADLERWRSELEGLLEQLVCVEGYYQLAMLEQRVAETWRPGTRERREALERGLRFVEAGLERFPEQHGLLLRGANLYKMAARASPSKKVAHLRGSLRLVERALVQRTSERWKLFREHRVRDLENLTKD